MQNPVPLIARVVPLFAPDVEHASYHTASRKSAYRQLELRSLSIATLISTPHLDRHFTASHLRRFVVEIS
jgi:hypothetical protein